MALRCLLIDDNADFLASASRLLEAQGLEIVGRASTSDGAVRLATALEPDVALVDVQLGDEDGLELARRLNVIAPATQVVLISTHSPDDVAELVADSPAVDFLAKASLSAAAIAAVIG